MKNEMSPLKVEILLWYYYSPYDYRDLDAPAIKEAIEDFIKLGILFELEKDTLPTRSRVYGCNQSALDVYVNAILEVPLPKQIWVCQK